LAGAELAAAGYVYLARNWLKFRALLSIFILSNSLRITEMFEINPVQNKIKELGERTDLLRGYL